MLKKVLSLSLVLAMVLTVFVGAVDYKDADDISDGAKDAVELVGYLGLMAGDGATGEFNPKNPITREETFRVLASLNLGGATDVDAFYTSFLTASTFDDKADVSAWAKKFAGYVTSLNLISGRTHKDGVEGKYLDPKGNITYNEMAVLLIKALGYGDDYLNSTGLAWPNNVALLGTQFKLFRGISATNFGSNATREDVAIMFVNAMDQKMVKRTVLFGEVSYPNVEGNLTLFQAKYGYGTGVVAASVKTVANVEGILADGKGYDTDKGDYILAAGEKLDPSLLGRDIIWSQRYSAVVGAKADRIKNAELSTKGWTVVTTTLDKLILKDNELKANGTSVAKKSGADPTISFVGNGIWEINDTGFTLGATAINENIPVTVSGKGDVAIVTGIYGAAYTVATKDYATVAVGKVEKIDTANNLVLVDVLTTGVVGKRVFKVADAAAFANGGIVKIYVDYNNALLGNNKGLKAAANKLLAGHTDTASMTDVADATLTVLSAVDVKGAKLVSVSGGYQLNGKTAAAATLAADGFIFANYVQYVGSASLYVFADGAYIYYGATSDGTGSVVAPTYLYGAVLGSNFSTSGSTVKVLMSDGSEQLLPINKIGSDNPGRATNPTFNDDGTYYFEVKEIVALTSPIVTLEKVGEKYNITDNFAADSTSVGGTASVIDISKKSISNMTTGLTLVYDNNTPFFVIAKDGKITVKKSADFKGNQTFAIDETSYVKAMTKDIGATGTKAIEVAVIKLSPSTTDLLGGNAVNSTDYVLLHGIPSINNNKLVINGFFGAESKVATLAVAAGTTLADLADASNVAKLVAGTLVKLTIAADEVTDIDVIAVAADKANIERYLPTYEALKNEIVIGGTVFTFNSSTKFYFLNKDGFQASYSLEDVVKAVSDDVKHTAYVIATGTVLNALYIFQK